MAPGRRFGTRWWLVFKSVRRAAMRGLCIRGDFGREEVVLCTTVRKCTGCMGININTPNISIFPGVVVGAWCRRFGTRWWLVFKSVRRAAMRVFVTSYHIGRCCGFLRVSVTTCVRDAVFTQDRFHHVLQDQDQASYPPFRVFFFSFVAMFIWVDGELVWFGLFYML